MRIRAVGLVSGLALFALGAALPASPEGGSAWYEPSEVTVRLSAADVSSSRVAMFVTKGGDARIEASGLAGGQSYSGTLMLISGSRMLTKDVPISPGAEIDALDGPVLQVRLVLELLARAFPGGPGTLTSPRVIDVSEPTNAISVNTQSAGGEFRAPWTLKGTARPDAAGKSFDLAFVAAGDEQPIKIGGSWSDAAKPPGLPDSFSVEGWRVFALGPHSRPSKSGGTIYEYGAQEILKKFATLGEVRRDAVKQK